MTNPNSTTIHDLLPHVTTPPRLCAVVIGDGIVTTHALPAAGGRLTIGRAPGNDLQIDHPSISRRHAVLELGSPMTLHDLGSANGTRVRDRWLRPGEVATIACGEAVELGATMLLVQERVAPLRPRRVWAHGYFEVRLAEECARAEASGGSFAVARVRCRGAASAGAIEETLADVLRTIDVVGYYAPGEYEVILADTRPAEAALTLERLIARLAERGAEAEAGLACWGRDGRGADALLARASREARGERGAEAPARPLLPDDGPMASLRRMIERVAPSTISVLILGETGVGKEVLADTIHKLSSRADKPLLRLNCAALSESLLESELFGHERGAFTGAVQAKQGLLETAQGGTIFLDEVGELPMSIQVKLLRVLEERHVLRVGALKPRPIDVRFVAATNRDLEAEVARGAFRQDLYFRLNGITVVIPPLRQRLQELPALAAAFAANAAGQQGKPTPRLSEEALGHLVRYAWPGNIRELRNVIERAVLLCGDGPILPEHLPLEKMAQATARLAPRSGNLALGLADAAAPLRSLAEEMERQRILEALSLCAGNQTEAARLLGISRRTLVNRLNEYAMPRPRKRRAGDELAP